MKPPRTSLPLWTSYTPIKGSTSFAIIHSSLRKQPQLPSPSLAIELDVFSLATPKLVAAVSAIVCGALPHSFTMSASPCYILCHACTVITGAPSLPRAELRRREPNSATTFSLAVSHPRVPSHCDSEHHTHRPPLCHCSPELWVPMRATAATTTWPPHRATCAPPYATSAANSRMCAYVSLLMWQAGTMPCARSNTDRRRSMDLDHRPGPTC